jgi:hypothetical protein
MANQRIAGLLQLKIGGEIQDAKGSFSYNLGLPKREEIVGADGVHGYKETPQAAFIEGMITDRGTLDVARLARGVNLTVTLALANKTIVLGEAWFAGDGTVTTEEAEIQVKWVSKLQGQEIT